MNTKNWFCYFFFIVFLFSISGIQVVKAQDGQDDFALLTQIGIQKKWKHNWATSLSVRAFWNENATEFNRGFINAGIQKSLSKRWDFGVNFRFYEVKNLQNFYEERFRLFVDLAYEYPLSNKLSLTWRGRIQRQSYGGLQEQGYEQARYTLRNKFSLSYQHNWYWNFYVSEEPFIPLNAQSNVFFSNFRTETGIKYRPNLFHSINLFYQLRHPVQLPFNTRYWILGLKYVFRI